MKRLYGLCLDILSIPGLFMTKKANAEFHLTYICPKCPKWRRNLRGVHAKECYWEKEWKKGNYKIPKTLGVKNYFMQYLFLKTDLRKFKKNFPLKRT